MTLPQTSPYIPDMSWPSSDILQITMPDFHVQFARSGGGFPTQIAFEEPDPQVASKTDRPWLSAMIDGERASPHWPEGYLPTVWRSEDSIRVEFRNIGWQYADGSVPKHFRLTLSYEFWPDGACFVRSFFRAETASPPQLSNIQLTPPQTIPPEHQVAWAYWERPQSVNADVIQAVGGVKRDLSPGFDIELPGMLAPLISFDYGEGDRRDKHIEWFMEGGHAVGPDSDNVCTTVRWDGNRSHLSWTILDQPRDNERPWQWRNQWGWTICRAPRRRRHPPLRLFHYFDSSERFPSDRQIEKMGAEGGDVLILHEFWRSDVQSGATPFDEDELQRVVDTAHRHSLRMMLYVRGNELPLREHRADWFDQLLERDRDGLYLDYGSPILYTTAADDAYPKGRIAFREWHAVMRALRRRVGENGLLLSHSGPFFAACGCAGLIDGYVAGEGERGVLLDSRADHAYYSGISVAPPTMWTAAFPDYRSPRAVPYLASVSQMPHITLGKQFPSSSLEHPREPGIVTFARPLWKLWGMLRGQQNVEVLHQQNAPEVFCTDSPDTAACCIQATEGSRLLILSNLSNQPKEAWVEMRITAREESQAVRLDPHAQPPASGLPEAVPKRFAADLPAYGLSGWFIGTDMSAWQSSLERFASPYPVDDDANKAWGAEIDALRSRRFSRQPHRHQFVRFYIPDLALCYEDSLIADLYDNWNALMLHPEHGEPQRLGYVGSRGLVSERPAPADHLREGVATPWIALHDLLPPGQHHLGLYSYHHGEPFYSFVCGQITDDTNNVESFENFRFANELDDDRSRLTFVVSLLPAENGD